jgi:hypothetical protein
MLRDQLKDSEEKHHTGLLSNSAQIPLDRFKLELPLDQFEIVKKFVGPSGLEKVDVLFSELRRMSEETIELVLDRLIIGVPEKQKTVEVELILRLELYLQHMAAQPNSINPDVPRALATFGRLFFAVIFSRDEGVFYTREWRIAILMALFLYVDRAYQQKAFGIIRYISYAFNDAHGWKYGWRSSNPDSSYESIFTVSKNALLAFIGEDKVLGKLFFTTYPGFGKVLIDLFLEFKKNKRVTIGSEAHASILRKLEWKAESGAAPESKASSLTAIRCEPADLKPLNSRALSQFTASKASKKKNRNAGRAPKALSEIDSNSSGSENSNIPHEAEGDCHDDQLPQQNLDAQSELSDSKPAVHVANDDSKADVSAARDEPHHNEQRGSLNWKPKGVFATLSIFTDYQSPIRSVATDKKSEGIRTQSHSSSTSRSESTLDLPSDTHAGPGLTWTKREVRQWVLNAEANRETSLLNRPKRDCKDKTSEDAPSGPPGGPRI